MYGHIMASLLLLEHWHCVKSVQIQSVQIIHKSLNSVLIQENTDQKKEIPYLDSFHTVWMNSVFLFTSFTVITGNINSCGRLTLRERIKNIIY